jgi:hypothetical protein
MPTTIDYITNNKDKILLIMFSPMMMFILNKIVDLFGI